MKESEGVVDDASKGSDVTSSSVPMDSISSGAMDLKFEKLNLSREFVERWEAVFIFPEWWIWDKKFWVWAFLLNQKIKNSKLLLFWIFRKNKKSKFKIDFLWKKDINKESNLKNKDLLEVWKIIFNKIKIWILKK